MYLGRNMCYGAPVEVIRFWWHLALTFDLENYYVSVLVFLENLPQLKTT